MQKLFHLVLELAGAVLIAASPVLIGCCITAVLYFNVDGVTTSLLLLPVIAGFIIGIGWAVRVYRKKGTMWYLSQTMATPDIKDQAEKDMSEN